MIILGNKHTITQKEKETLLTKINTINYIDISNNIDEKTIENIKFLIEKNDAEFIVLNLEKEISLKLRSYLEELDYEGINVYMFSEFTQEFLDRKYVEFNEKNLKLYDSIHHKTIYQNCKRIFDFLFSIFAIVIFSPMFLLIALFIKIRSPEGSILFTQRRLGLNNSYFRVYKFRTMLPNAEEILKDILEKNDDMREEYLKFRKLKQDPRIIPGIGEFLRKSSLDELPQFFNVLFGDMSIVGPRPYIQDEFYSHDDKFKDIILSLKPGITGYWQVGERHNDTFENRVEKDLEYKIKQSFILDVKIIFQTINTMILRRGL